MLFTGFVFANQTLFEKIHFIIDRIESSDDEIDPDEVTKLLKEIYNTEDNDREIIDNDTQDQLPEIKYSLPNDLQVQIVNCAQQAMSDSSKDEIAATNGILHLTLLSGFGNTSKAKLDNLYYLGLLYFNKHSQHPEFAKAYLAMSAAIFIKFYNLASQSKYNNTTYLAKGLIRAAYATYCINDKATLSKIMATYDTKYNKYRPSDAEKAMLKRVRM